MTFETPYCIRPNETVQIVDLSGRVVFSGDANMNKDVCNTLPTINISALPKGIYFVKIETDKDIVTEKFVKE